MLINSLKWKVIQIYNQVYKAKKAIHKMVINFPLALDKQFFRRKSPIIHKMSKRYFICRNPNDSKRLIPMFHQYISFSVFMEIGEIIVDTLK